MDSSPLSAITPEHANGEHPVPALVQPTRTARRFEFADNAKASVPQKPRRVTAKRLALWAVGALAAAGLTAFTYHWWTVGRFIQSTNDAYVGGDVTVIAPKVAGFIAKLTVADNQPVHAGDLLLKLEPAALDLGTL